MGLQIPYRICTQVSPKEAVRKISQTGWRNNSGIMPATRSGTGRRAFNARPYPHVSERAAKVQHSLCDRFSKRQKRGTDPPNVVEAKAGIWLALLGQGILCQYGWFG